MSSTCRLTAAALAISCLLAPTHARAEACPSRELRPFIHGDVLRAGEIVEIRWDDFGSDVPEMEILLSLDGGRNFPLRVTPELDPRAGRYLWRVPDFSSGDARLRIRFGHGSGESWGEPGESFQIIGVQGVPDFNVIHESGWWAGLDAQAGARRDGTFDSGAGQIGRGAPPITAATTPGGPGEIRPTRIVLRRGDGRVAVAPPPSRSDGTTPTRMVMRN